MSGQGALLRRSLQDRVKRTISAALLLGILGIAASNAGGPSAALLDLALLGLALWLSRGESPQLPTAAPSRGGSMTGNQALLLVLALGGAAVLVAAGASSRPLHGLAVAPFAMASFALSSHNARDLRSGVFAAVASLLVLSTADDRWPVMALCAAGLIPLVFAWMAVRQLMALDRYPDRLPVLAQPRRRPWSVMLVVRLVVLTVVAVLLLPTEPPPHLRAGNGSGAPNGSGSDSSAQGSRGDAINSDGTLDLRNRGTLDAQPVIDVPADLPQLSGNEQLWQGGFVDSYDGATWTSTPDTAVRAGLEWPLPLQSTNPPPGVQRSEVHRLTAGQFLVYAPGPLVAANAAAGKLYDLGTGSVAIAGADHDALRYTVDWRTPGTTWDGTLSQYDPAVTDGRFLQLPAELPQRDRALAHSITDGEATLSDKVAAVAAYLGAHEKYQLDSPVPGPGVDAVDAFLFRDHLGFCEQFASAETVLLRAVGIPARVATGFGGNGVLSKDGARRIYRNQDAHAWVQVGEAGQRWVNSDPTAGSQLAPAPLKDRLTTWLKQLWSRLTGTADARRLLALALLLLLVAGLLLGRLAVRWRLARKARRLAVQPGAQLQTDAGRAYLRLLARLSEQGRPRRPTETVRDLLVRLGADDRDAVARVLEAEWYGRPGPLTAEQVGRAVAVLDQLALVPAAVGAAGTP